MFWDYNKTVSNARLMIDTYFVVKFKYVIEYVDGNKGNTHITNLVLRKTGTQTRITGTELLEGIKKVYTTDGNGKLDYYKIIVSEE